jgi:hypothetical protein
MIYCYSIIAIKLLAQFRRTVSSKLDVQNTCSIFIIRLPQDSLQHLLEH